jgi:hypothetical protein
LSYTGIILFANWFLYRFFIIVIPISDSLLKQRLDRYAEAIQEVYSVVLYQLSYTGIASK